MKELVSPLTKILARIEKAKKTLAVDQLQSRLKDLEAESSKDGFWNNQEEATKVSTEISDIKKEISTWQDLETKANELLQLSKITDEHDHEIIREIREDTEKLTVELDSQEFTMLFSGKYDRSNTILSVYSGSGGVDAQDWAEMLLKMYLKFSEKQGFGANILSISSGDEAGIKSVTVEITGPWSYGYLRGEAGVHRLVRLSPYDADKARHTSFALVDVIPEVEAGDYTIDEKDLRIETFRASGHGGQSVNTTDSAVRVTHIPTGLNATSQKERSQLQNKNQALKVLASRLKILEEKKLKKEISEIRGETLPAEWGNQIRSYVLHPYNMVKDHRTGQETSSTSSVLEGNIDEFIESYLRDSIAGR